MAYAICENCGEELEKDDVARFGDGFCHILAIWNENYEDFEPEPCGPVIIQERCQQEEANR